MINVPNEIKQLCAKDSIRKNFRVHFINGEHEDITNENILTESVSFTESICSGSLKFGMCEASVLSFDCDLSENLKGAEIEAQIEIDISTESQEFIENYGQTADDVDYPFYAIPYGKFYIKDCKKQKNGLRKVNAYTLLLGDEKITSDGTRAFSDYGLNPIEVYKMEYPWTNSSYIFNVFNFLVSNIPGFEKPSESVEMDRSSWQSISSITSIFEYIIDSDGHRIPSERLQYSAFGVSGYAYTDSANKDVLYYYDCETSEIPTNVILGFIHDSMVAQYGENVRYKFSDVDKLISYAQSNFFLNSLFLSRGSVSKVGRGYIYPYFYSGIPWYLNIPTNYRVVLPVYGSSTEVAYSYELDSKYAGTMSYISKPWWVENIVQFPRTKNSNGEYVVDYRALFGDGLTVTTKDRAGNVTETKYSFSFRDMVESYAEINASFGMFWRSKNAYQFSPLRFPTGLYPIDGLYPGSDIVPSGADRFISRSEIADAEWDDELTKPYGKVVCTCTPQDATAEVTLEYDIIDTSNMTKDAYLVYDLSDNYYIKTFPQLQSTIVGYMQTIANALRGMRYMPCDITLKGLPFIETGDWVEFETMDGTMITNVMSQTITGVQTLMTTIESEE